MSLKTRAGNRARAALHRAGLDLRRFDRTLPGRRIRLVKGPEVDLVVDVGAHAGEYAGHLLAQGYRGPIVSFEPIRAHFERLSANARPHPAWECRHLGLGPEPATAEINVAGNDGFSSSLLEMKETHAKAAEDSRYERTETITVSTLDREIEGGGSVYLKVDSQGYEREILRGAGALLGRCRAIEIELSLVELYDSQPLMGEMVELLAGHGFVLTHVEPEFADPATGQILQLNGLFQPK